MKDMTDPLLQWLIDCFAVVLVDLVVVDIASVLVVVVVVVGTCCHYSINQMQDVVVVLHTTSIDVYSSYDSFVATSAHVYDSYVEMDHCEMKMQRRIVLKRRM